MAVNRTKKAHSYNRSRITNGRELLPGLDGRTALARRFRDISNAIAVDQGGADRMSEVRQQLVRRFSALCCLAEKMEAELASGANINVVEHCAMSSALVRIATRLGLGRKAKEIPALQDYLKGAGRDAVDPPSHG